MGATTEAVRVEPQGQRMRRRGHRTPVEDYAVAERAVGARGFQPGDRSLRGLDPAFGDVEDELLRRRRGLRGDDRRVAERTLAKSHQAIAEPGATDGQFSHF